MIGNPHIKNVHGPILKKKHDTNTSPRCPQPKLAMASLAIDQLTCLDCPALTGPLNFWGKRKHLGPEQVATSATGPVMAKEVVNVVRLLAEFVLLRVNAVHRLMFSMYIMH
jgi:hypothetical protein